MSSSNRKRILVVDDEPVARRITVKQLEARSHDVVEATSGEAALEILRRSGPVDLLVLDIVMPEMNGFETLARLDELGLRTMPVIMLSARTDDDQIIEGYRSGADYYLTKPCKRDALLNIIDFLIGEIGRDTQAQLERII